MTTHLSEAEQDQFRRLYKHNSKLKGIESLMKDYKIICEAGLTISTNEVKKIYQEIDADNNGVIDESQFLRYMEKVKTNFNIGLELESIFLALAQPEGIPKANFRDFVMRICPNLTEEQADHLSSQIDIDFDGYISKDEFNYIFREYGKKSEDSKKKKD